MSDENATGQSIEQLKQRYEKLNEMRIKVQAQRESAQAQLQQLRKNAREQFGTDDVSELQARLAEMKQENERQRAEYEQGLDEIETKLEQIDAESDEGTQK